MMRMKTSDGGRLLLVLVCLGLLGLSACKMTSTRSQATGYFDLGRGNQMIPLPKVRDKDLAAAKSRGRIGVAALTVDATTKMEKLETSIQREAYNVGSHWTNWERRTRTHQAHYYLGQDFEPVARSVLSGLFEIDPSSTRKAHVMARVWIDSKRDRNIWCRYWDTKATVSFSVLIQERDKSQTIQHYEGQDTGTDCATLFLFPSGERVGEIVQGAFDTMMKRIGEAR